MVENEDEEEFVSIVCPLWEILLSGWRRIHVVEAGVAKSKVMKDRNPRAAIEKV